MSGYVPNPPKNHRYAEAKPVDIHARHWAEYEKHGKQPQPAKAKTSLALRIGVFFDGTLNNASNTAAGLLCGAHHPIQPEDVDASCKPYMADPEGSYGNDTSNIAKLFELYPAKEVGDETSKRVMRGLYIDGIGTTSGEEDSLGGAATGRGGTGVAGKVQNAFIAINRLIQQTIQENAAGEIVSLTFETFGFSRGAAAARHFANEVVRCKQGPLGEILRTHSNGFSPLFDGRYNSEIMMGFIGLFDTVPSIAGFTNFGNLESPVAPGIKLYLDRKYFTDVLQIVARDEHRANFALSSVAPAHPEITVPGVHSDIGGGYRDEVEECVLVSPMQALTVRQKTDIRQTSIYQDAIREKATMVANGWPESMLEIVTPTPGLLPSSKPNFEPQQVRAYAGLQLKRPVSGKLSIVYLRLMHKLAKEKGVQFDLIDDNDPAYSVPSALKSFCESVLAGKYNPAVEDEKLLKLSYIHSSANWNNPLGGSRERGLTIRYTNAPTANGVRVKHPHVPDSSWRVF